MRPLGNSGIEVSPLAIGCWSFGGGAYWGGQAQRDVNEVVALALERGVNFFDTAELYNAGESERSLGAALAGRRAEAVICSKVGPDHAYPGELARSCEESLRRLNTDYIDVYLLHWPINYRSVLHFTSDERKQNNLPRADEAFEAMVRLKQAGKVRAVGLSNFGLAQMKEALAAGAPIDVNQLPYNIFSRAIEASIQPFCVERGISIVCSMALMQGVLTGKYAAPGEVPPGLARTRHFAKGRGGGASRHESPGVEAALFEALERLKRLARDCGVTLAQMAVAWTLARGGVAATLAGCRNAAQLHENLGALSLRLPEDVIEKIDAISAPILSALGDSPDYYETDENSRIY